MCMCVSVRFCEKMVLRNATIFSYEDSKTPECAHVKFGFLKFLLVFILFIFKDIFLGFFTSFYFASR